MGGSSILWILSDGFGQVILRFGLLARIPQPFPGRTVKPTTRLNLPQVLGTIWSYALNKCEYRCLRSRQRSQQLSFRSAARSERRSNALWRAKAVGALIADP